MSKHFDDVTSSVPQSTPLSFPEFLFEMSVEVVFGHQAGESWDQGVATLLTSLKNTVGDVDQFSSVSA